MGNFVTKHFTASELTTTNTGLQNEPTTKEVWCNLTRLCCDVLEPLRALTGALKVNSGYRSPAVNKAVGGAQNSAHCYGRAADVVPFTGNALDAIKALEQSNIQFDKAIFEVRSGAPWLHVQVRHVAREPRRLCFMSLSAGSYEVFDCNDQRLDRWK